MSLQRSPPNASTSVKTIEHSITPSHITQRAQKRKQGDDLEVFMSKMESMFKDWAEKQDKKYQRLLDSVEAIKVQNREMMASMDAISSQYDDIKLKIEKLEQEKKSDLAYIQSLEHRIEYLDRISKSSCVELRNIPLSKNENIDNLFTVVSNLCKTLDVPIVPADIRNIYRGYSKNDSKKPIIVDFSSVMLKYKVVSSFKLYNKEHSTNKLNTTQIKLDGPCSLIYVADYLTPKMKRLHFLARDFASTNNYKFCWSTQGTIYLRKKEGDQPIKLKNELDLINLKNKL